MRLCWLLAALLLLGGCGFSSFEPLIAESEPPPGIAGHYQVFTAGSTEGLSAEEAANMTCITVGASVPPRSYCYFERQEDRGDVPRFIDIERRGEAFTFLNPEEQLYGAEPAVPETRFLRLADTVYLMQIGEQGERFTYLVLRMSDGGIELFAPSCGYFPKSTQPHTRQYESSCTASSLAAIRPELDAFVARILAEENMPMRMAFLKRR